MSTTEPSWPEGPARTDPEATVRLHFHIALAGVALALLAPLLTWGLWLLDWQAPRSPWKRRLLALAIVDTVLVLGLAAARVSGVDVERNAGEPPRIGIAIDPRGSPPGVAVDRVAPESPAAHAALREGDHILTVDGHHVESAADLTEEIERTPRGAARRLEVLRHGRSFEVSISPEVGAPVPARRSGSLFENLERGPPRGAPTQRRFVLGAGAIDLAIVAALVVAARRRRAPVAPGFAVLAGLVALTLVSSAVLLAFQATIGVSLGAVLVALLSGSTALLVTDLVAVLLLRPAPLRVGPPIRTPKAIALGALYGITGAARVAIVVAIVASALHLPLRSASGAFGLSLSWGPLGVALFVLAAVVVTPFAEELLFRGILLPWLARWMKPATALAVSAVVFGLGHLYYGVGALLIGFYGLVLGWARLRTGKIWASVTLHALLNGTTAAALLIQSAR